MASSTALSAETLGRLETARRILGLSQADLSGLAGISQGNISNCLKGRVVRVDSLRRLLSAFGSIVASADERGVTPEQAKEIEKTVEAARSALAGGTPEASPYFARPGAPMPENAANRVERPEDNQLLKALDDAPFTAAVIGPPECGKSTLLQLLAAEARRRGFAVAEFDARIVLPPEREEAINSPEPDDENQLSIEFFSELANEAHLTLGGEPPEVENRFGLLRYLKQTRLSRSSPPLLIVVYHASEIPLALEELVQVCRSLDAQKGRTQMSWAIEAIDIPGDNRLGVLSRLSPSPLVELGWLDRPAVEQFFGLYDIEDSSFLEELWLRFEGQPFLTHLALTRFREFSLDIDTATGSVAREKLAKEINHADNQFAHHIARIKGRLRKHSRWRENSTLEKFIASCSHDPQVLGLAKIYGVMKLTARKDLDLQTYMLGIYRDHLL